MSEIVDKITGEIWNELSPFVSGTRVLILLFLLIAFSNESSKFLEITTYDIAINAFIPLIYNVIISNEFWKLLTVLFWVFVISPVMINLFTKYCIKLFHMNFAGSLLNKLLDIKKIAKRYSPSDLQYYLNLQGKGYKNLAKLKNRSEIVSSVLIVPLIIFIQQDPILSLLIVICWTLAQLLISHKILVVIMDQIEPFNIIRSEREIA